MSSARTHPSPEMVVPIIALFLSQAASAQPVLPDWTAATFGAGSSISTNTYYPLQVGTLSIYEGMVSDGLERIEVEVRNQTVNILGVQNRVIRDSAFIDGVLVEVAEDWYAQDTDGNVWYFGESVVNYRYDDDGVFLGTDTAGSWIADGVTNMPGIIMWAHPMIGDEYYQEYAPGVAFDFAVVNSLTDSVDVTYGAFTNVLHTSEGNLFDGPELAENKLYAPDIGLALIQELDDAGLPEFEIELIERRMVPAPSAGVLLAAGALVGASRRRVR